MITKKPFAIVIEDNLLNIDVLMLFLQQEDVEAAAFTDLEKLLAALPELPIPDVIFLDLEFPKATGFEVIKVIRAEKKLAETHIVAYTVHISEMNEVRAAGFNSFLGKPLNGQRFSNQLKRILNGESVWES